MSDELQLIEVTISQAIRMVTLALKAKRVPMIHGSPAIGKSSIVHQIAKQYNLKLIDMRLSQCDPTDLMGFPTIVNGRAGYVPMETFPIDGDAMPLHDDGKTVYAGWLLFLDEFNSAPRAVQAAAYKLVLDRMVGKHRLHPNVAMVCAGNLSTDGAIVEETSTAMQSRLTHINLVVDTLEFINWAGGAGIDHRITSYLSMKPGNLYTFKADHSDRTYASPRTWEMANDFIKLTSIKDPDLLPLLAGTITEGVTREFLAFCDIYTNLPSIASIIADPHGVVQSDEPSILFAMSGAIAHHVNDVNITPLMVYMNRMPKEFQVVCLRQIMHRNKAMKTNPEVVKWVTANASSLF